MRESVYSTLSSADIQSKVFVYLVENGLENVSIRELCRETGLSQGCLYYWFGDKTSILCESTKFGLRQITDTIFGYVFENTDSFQVLFSECLTRLDAYHDELRFIYQMASSPVYGEQIRRDGKYFKQMYDSYAERLSERLECAVEKVRPLVYLFVSAICDYAVWEDRENAQTELDYLSTQLERLVKTEAVGSFENVDFDTERSLEAALLP